MFVDESKIFVDRAKKDYSSKELVKRYTELAQNFGLWKSEEFIFKKFLKNSDCIIDVGCGAGRTTEGLYKLGFTNIIGTDISKALIKQAKQRAKEKGYRISYFVDDIIASKFKNASCDAVVFSYNGLMTIPGRENRIKAVQEISRILKPNGIFIFTTHDREHDDKWQEFWKEEKRRWETGTQDKKLFEYGDRIINHFGQEIFIHIPCVKGVYSLLKRAHLKVIYTKMRWDICATPKIEKETFGECRFYVAKKEM